MHKSGRFFAGSKSAGLVSTPSMVVPSLLFQEMTSDLPRIKERVCLVMSVSLRGEKPFTSEMKTSRRELGEPVTKAIWRPSCVREKPKACKLSELVRRVIWGLSGWMRNR